MLMNDRFVHSCRIRIRHKLKGNKKNQWLVKWMTPQLNDGVHPSHHRSYGSRIRRFAVYLSNRSLHQLKLFCTFSKGYRFSWESVTQLAKINAPIEISRRTAFSPSTLMRPMQFYAPRLPWVLWPRLASLLYQLEFIETSPGNCIFFHSIVAVST
jgi:hypothetical protein